MRAIPQAAIDFLKLREKCVLRVYDDARPGAIMLPTMQPIGKLTAGYGHTGLEVFAGMVVTQANADAWLADDLKTASSRLGGVVSREVIDALTDNQYSALLAFVFNLGAGASWTIWKVLNAKQFDQVPLEMMKFVNAGGKKLQGLVNRRAAEVALWATGEPGTVDADPPSSVTRNMETQPTPADAVPASKSKTILTGIVGTVATVPVAVQQVTSAISPYAAHSSMIAKIIAVLATIGGIAAALVVAFAYINKSKARN